MRHEVSFDTTLEDAIAAADQALRDNATIEISAQRTRRKSVRMLLVLSPLALGFAWLIVAEFCDLEDALPVILALALGLLLYRLYLRNSDVYHRNLRRIHLKRVADSWKPRSQRVVLEDEAVTILGLKSEHRFRWTAVIGVTETDGHILLALEGWGATAIPRRAFASAEDAERFAEYARSHWLRAVPEAELWKRFADVNLPCPRCGYNLRGAQSNRCPECALHITPELAALATTGGRPTRS